MNTFKCLMCGTTIESAKPPSSMIRCSNLRCRSYFVLPLNKYEAIIGSSMPIINDDTPFLDKIHAFISVLAFNGISGRPLRTLKAAAHIVEECERRNAQKKGASNLSVVV